MHLVSSRPERRQKGSGPQPDVASPLVQMVRLSLAQAHGGEQLLADLAISWQVRIVSVIVRIIAVWIVPVVWIRIVKERTSKIAKEEERIIEVAMVETTVIPTSIAQCSGPRHAMGNARPSAVEARC